MPGRNEDEESNTDSKEPPKSTSAIYMAEGNKLYRMSRFREAIESYTMALQQADLEEEGGSDKRQSYYSRALCHLSLGESEQALTDAEEALELDGDYIKALWAKAEALYVMGDFEYALMFYHRGYQTRSDFADFKIGIQKSQEAIENAIGKENQEDLSQDGDLGMFYNRDLTQNYITFSEKRMKDKKGGATKREEKKKDDSKAKKEKTSKKNSRRLLREIYSDKEFLENLFKDEAITNPETETGKKIHDYTSDVLDYLGKREEFWRQQNPGRLHLKKQERTTSGRVINTAHLRKNDPGRYLYRQLETIQDDLERKKYKPAEKRCKEVLDEARTYNENELPSKAGFMATIYGLLGNALMEQDRLEAAETNHQKDLEMSKEADNFDGQSRALDNLGKVSVKMGNFEKAIQYWETKLQLLQQHQRSSSSKSGASGGERAKTAKEAALEKTWLYHEIARCHLEQGDNAEAKEYGERALASAKTADDQVWELNSLVLIAKAETRMDEHQSAAETFEKALELTKELDSKDAQRAVEKALKDVNDKIVKGMRAEEKAEEKEQQRVAAVASESPSEQQEQQQQTPPKKDSPVASPSPVAEEQKPEETPEQTSAADEGTGGATEQVGQEPEQEQSGSGAPSERKEGEESAGAIEQTASG